MSEQFEKARAKRLESVRLGLEEPPVAVYIFPMGEAGTEDALRFAKRVREAGVSCVLDTRDAKMKKKFSLAEEEGAFFVLVIGDAEHMAGTITVKDMAARSQQALPPDEVLALLVREAKPSCRC